MGGPGGECGGRGLPVAMATRGPRPRPELGLGGDPRGTQGAGGPDLGVRGGAGRPLCPRAGQRLVVLGAVNWGLV